VLVVALDTLTQVNRQLIVELAAKHRLPAVYASSEFFGCLVTYGGDYADVYRLTIPQSVLLRGFETLAGDAEQRI
jgi:hypothetical protein